MGGEALRKSGFEGQRGLITGFPQHWEKQKLHSWRVHTGLVCTRTEGKKEVTSLETGPDLTPSIEGSPGEVGGGYGSPWGKKTLAVAGLVSTLWQKPSWRPPLPSQDLAPPNNL